MSHQLCWVMEDGAGGRGSTEGGTGLAGQSHPLEVTLAPKAVLVLVLESAGAGHQIIRVTWRCGRGESCFLSTFCR